MLGVLGTLVATSLFEPDPNVGFAASFGYFLVYGVPAGLALGAVVALVLDAASRRRARTATVEREAGGASEDEAPEDPPPGDPQPEDPPAGDRPVS